nr:hypothetical protein [Tanacetum cinerariifolium]
TADEETVADLGISDRVGVDTEDGIGMEVKIIAGDIREDGEEFKTDASARGTMEIVVDLLVTGGVSESTRRDVPDLEGTFYDIVRYMSEVPLDRITELRLLRDSWRLEEFRQIRRDYDDARRILRRLESFVERHLGFRP